MRLVLASGSPRRRRLLEEAGIPFDVVPSGVEEPPVARGDPHEVALAHARRKAAAVAGECVLAADTVVAVGDRLLGKPADDGEARAMLRLLSGTTHRVVTAVVVRVRGDVRTASVETRVTMRALTEAEIDAYVATGEPTGKAGAYAIQESGDRFVVRLDGPFDNVVGLPVDAVRGLLRDVRIQ
jgi:septum formation protein